MRSFALLALLAATVYADGHLPTSGEALPTEAEHHDEDHEGNEMNTAELLAQAIDNVAELFMEEVELGLIDDDKIQPISAFESAKDLKKLLELVC